jgi:hypothetical protein
MEQTVHCTVYLHAAPSVTSHGPQRRGGDDHRLFGRRHQVDSPSPRLALLQVAGGDVNAVASLEDLLHGDDAVDDVTHVQAHQLLFQLLLPPAPFEKRISYSVYSDTVPVGRVLRGVSKSLIYWYGATNPYPYF